MEYDFGQQLQAGEAGERALDAYFSQFYEITVVLTREQKRDGIDRLFVGKRDRIRFSVEYKTDYLASKTGNCFIETVSMDTTDAPGWAVKSLAQVLVYYIPGWNRIYMLPMYVLKGALREWRQMYPEVASQNNGYCTWGLKVPIEELAELSLCKQRQIPPMPESERT